MSSTTSDVGFGHQTGHPASDDSHSVVTCLAADLGKSSGTPTISSFASHSKEDSTTPAPSTGSSAQIAGEASALPPLPSAVATSQETVIRESTNTATVTDSIDKSVQRTSPANPKTSGEDDMASSTLSWTAEGPFDLYCKKTGQSHAVLTAFGYWKCPRCDQSLNQPKIQISDRESDQDSSSDKVEPAQSKSDNFSYSVRYVDDEHHLIYSEPWQGPFDLHEARKCVLSLIQTKPILRVETVLETCIPGDMDRHYYEAEKIKASGILNNPLVDVAVWRIAVTIMSPVLVQAIRKLVSYDPSEDLHGRTLGLGRHHELVWHHLDDFKKYIEQPDEDNGTRLAKPHLRQLLALVASINGQGVDDEKARHGVSQPLSSFPVFITTLGKK